MSTTSISLYHADWCGHCTRFKPTWEALKPEFKKHNITFNEYEHSKNSNEIREAGVTGFPTIKITKNNNTYDYTGPRDPTSILDELNKQYGGSIDYKHKYIKYKQKYNALKEKMDNS